MQIILASVEDENNSYYVFLGLSNPTGAETLVGYGDQLIGMQLLRTNDSFSYRRHSADTMMFGKKVSSANIRRIIRRVDWVSAIDMKFIEMIIVQLIKVP